MPKSWWHTRAVAKSQVLGTNAGSIHLWWAKFKGLCQDAGHIHLWWPKDKGLHLDTAHMYQQSLKV